MKLDNWALRISRYDPFKAPEMQTCVLVGEAYQHPDPWILDGEFIYTSTVQKIEEGIAYTRNSEYELGEPDPDYVKWCEENGYEIGVIL